MLELFGIVEAPIWTGPKYNLAPTQDLLVLRDKAGVRLAQPMRWGLVPSWAKDLKIGNQLINARSETIKEKASFRTALRRRRGLVVTDGFYEWERHGKSKKAWRIGMVDGRPFALGALFEHWKGPDESWITSCTVLTTGANPLVGQIHDRMPVIIEPAHHGLWLDSTLDESPALDELLVPREPKGMHMVRVSDYVNDVRRDGPEAAQPLAGADAEIRVG